MSPTTRMNEPLGALRKKTGPMTRPLGSARLLLPATSRQQIRQVVCTGPLVGKSCVSTCEQTRGRSATMGGLCWAAVEVAASTSPAVMTHRCEL